MRLVDDVDLVRPQGRREVDLLAEVADLVDAAIRCRVDLDQVQGGPGRHLEARLAPVARLRRVTRPARAVDRLGQQASRRRLSRTPRAAEEIGMRDAARDDRALQRPRRGVLADEVAKGLRAVLAVEGLILRHGAIQWSRTLASIQDPQLVPRFAAPAQMTAAPPGSLLTAASFRT